MGFILWRLSKIGVKRMDTLELIADLTLAEKDELERNAEDDLEAAQLREAIFEVEDAVSPKSVELIETPSKLEYAMQILDRMDPDLRPHFEKAVLMKHYGVEVKKQEGELVLFNDALQQVAPNREVLEKLQRRIFHITPSDNMFERNKRNLMEITNGSELRNLRYVAKTGVIDNNDTALYVKAVVKVNKALNKWSLLNPGNHTASRHLKYGNFFPLLWVLAKDFGGNGIEGNHTKYFAALEKHQRKHCQTLDDDIFTAYHKSKELIDQLRDPLPVNGKYSNKVLDLEVKMDKAFSYLSWVNLKLKLI